MTDTIKNILETAKENLKEYFNENPDTARIDLENTIDGIIETAQINLGATLQEELEDYLDELIQETEQDQLHNNLMNTHDFQNKKNVLLP